MKLTSFIMLGIAYALYQRLSAPQQITPLKQEADDRESRYMLMDESTLACWTVQRSGVVH